MFSIKSQIVNIVDFAGPLSLAQLFNSVGVAGKHP